MVIDNLSATLRTKLHQRLDYTVHTLVTGNRAEDMIQACRPWGYRGCHGTPRFW